MLPRPLCSLLLVIITFCVSSRQQEFVSTVAQNYNERLNHQLQQQISSYVTQEVAYIAYSSYYERADVALPGFHKFFSSLAITAGEHARNLTTLVNERGGRVRYPVIQNTLRTPITVDGGLPAQTKPNSEARFLCPAHSRARFQPPQHFFRERNSNWQRNLPADFRLKTACEKIRKELRKGEITKPIDSQTVTVSARRNPHVCDFLLVNNPFTTHKKKTSKHLSWFTSAKKDTKETQDRDTWQEGLFGLEDVLALENTVLTEILNTHGMAATYRDPLTRHRLEHYLEAQVDSVYRVAQLVERLQDHRSLDTYTLEEYLLDSHLMEA